VRLCSMAARIEGFEGFFVDFLVFVDVDGSADVALEAGVEEAGGFGEGGCLGEGEFDDVFVGFSGADNSGVGEDGSSHLLPLLDDFGVGGVDEGANVDEGFAAPVGEGFEFFVDEMGGGF